MSSPQPFHVRKALNVLTRASTFLPPSKRTLIISSRHAHPDTVSIDDHPPTATETLRYLQHQDQAKLQATHSALNAYLRATRALDTFATQHTSTRIGGHAYHLAGMRARAHSLTQAWQEVQQRGMVLKEHLTDLQHEPYQADMDAQLHAWQRELASKDDFELWDLYQSSGLEDAAKVNRVRRQVDALHRRVRIAAGLQRADVDDDELGAAWVDPQGNWRTMTTTTAAAEAAEAAEGWRADGQEEEEEEEEEEEHSTRNQARTNSSSVNPPPRPSSPAQAPQEPALPAATHRRSRRTRPITIRRIAGKRQGETGPDKEQGKEASPQGSTLKQLSLAMRRRSLAEEQRRVEREMQQHDKQSPESGR
nr:hypothetical protein CFP56_10213 [Quercus suber]